MTESSTVLGSPVKLQKEPISYTENWLKHSSQLKYHSNAYIGS